MSVNPNDTTINNTERLNRRLTELQQLPDKVRKGGGGSGAEGKEGKSQGLRYKFNTGTTEVDPGSGKIALNSSTPPTAGLIRISETDANGNALGGFLAGWDDSTNTVRGQVMIRSISSETDLLIFNITGALTDKGTWDQIAVTNVTSSGTFSNEEEVLVTFTRAGDKGIDGAEGAPGTEGKEGPSGKEGPAGAATMNGFKEPVKAAATGNITISTALNPGDTLDGVVLAENDRVLVPKQTTKKENGIWIVKAVPVRATDADAAGELRGGTTVYIEQGTVNEDRQFAIITNGSITPGTTEHEWKATSRKTRTGESTIVFPGGKPFSNVITVTHNLQIVPDMVNVISTTTEGSEVGYSARIIERTATTFKVRFFSNINITAAEVTFLWEVGAW